ncbi:bile acid:sodium symporter family protein [Metabacillus litoralis]|uniref:bile acid:sodium symporter family protein n=1 Tax=Metabacillus litoralis TaxID=152268 RepID=UPI000EF5CB4F|nr:bile acid:sodium symporter family protein [Metabacillus litoralis]MCM3160079.1 bile acid:sodium symporter family protein [Metabacillus litoralis]MCM3408663.1 bile acid:sodium symporter family protein [Metabacillus litoralis]
MLQTVNRQLEKWMPIITPISVMIGVMLAENLLPLTFLIPWLFAFMTFSGSLSSTFTSLTGALKKPLPLFIILMLLHIIMPLLAWTIGHAFFVNDHLTMTGLVLASVIPTGITSFIWVTIYKGNIGLALSIILFDTLLSPFLVPFTLSFLVGQKIQINTMDIMYGLLFMVVIPSILGIFTNFMTKGKSVKAGKTLAPFSKIALACVVMMNGAVISPYLKQFSLKLVIIAITVLILASFGYFLAWMLSILFKRDRETKVVMMFTGGMRNISAGAVIAVQYFPAAVAVPVVLGMLFQQVLASIFGLLFHLFDQKQKQQIEGTISVSQ